MSVTRSLAMADLDTQIQQAQIYAVPPTGPSGNTGVGGVRGAPTTPLEPERTTSQYPTERQSTSSVEPPTRIINPYLNTPYGVTNPGIAPPPPTAEKDAEKAQQREQQANRTNARAILQGTQLGLQTAGRGLKAQGDSLNRRLGSIPTPGDIWVPFFILLILFLIIIPVKGHSRMYWLWLVIIGHAHIGTPFQSQNEYYQQQVDSSGGVTEVPVTYTATTPSITPLTNNGLQLQPPTTIPTIGGGISYLSSINVGEY